MRELRSNPCCNILTANVRCGESPMPQLITGPAVIAASGTKTKRIEEYIGRIRSGTEDVSMPG